MFFPGLSLPRRLRTLLTDDDDAFPKRDPPQRQPITGSCLPIFAQFMSFLSQRKTKITTRLMGGEVVTR